MSLISQVVDCTVDKTNPQCLGNLLKLRLANPTTGITEKTVGDIYPNFASFLNLFIPLAFIGSGLILLFLLIGGGFSIIASGGNAKTVEQGKNQIAGAVIGFLLIFAAYWIIQIIQTITGVQIFNSGL